MPDDAPPDRPALRAALDAAVARLVARAAAERWPVRADHCFRRIAYDAAVGAKWDTMYARPAWASLPLDRLAAAVAVLGEIDSGGRAALDPLNAASLAGRGHRRRRKEPWPCRAEFRPTLAAGNVPTGGGTE